MQRARLLSILKNKGLSNFQIKVLTIAAAIPKGETRTYKWVAKLSGRPKACRAVGNALNKNPFPVIIPCHRVIRSNGAIGGYKLGTKKKIRALRSDGALLK